MKKILGKIITICIMINLILIAISTSIQANVEDGKFTNKEIPYAITAKKVDNYGSSLFLDDQGRVWDTAYHPNMETVDCLTQLFKDSGLVFKDIAAGSGFIILLDEDGYMYTSGKNDFYQLGNGNRSTTATTELVAIGGTRTFSKIFANKQTGYAITSDGKLYAWGDNTINQATTSNVTYTEYVVNHYDSSDKMPNTYNCQSVPTQILTDYRFESLSANADSVIAITTDKKAIAWGDNRYCKLVTHSNPDRPGTKVQIYFYGYALDYDLYYYIQPTVVSDTLRFKKVSVGVDHSIFLTTDNKAYTIGNNNKGQTGTSHNNTQLEQPIGLEDAEVLDILAGFRFSGFIDSNHTVWMCGANDSKQLGNSTGTNSSTIARIRVTGLSTDRFAVGDTANTVLVYDTSGNVWGWGYNYGLGANTSNSESIQLTGIRPQATITFNNQGATTTGTESITASYGYAMPSITLPQKTGYTFNGYFTSTNGSGIKYYNANGTSARNWDSSYDTTLYAYWIVSNYTIEYNLNGGSLASGASNPTTGTVGSYVYISNVPTKTGYTFAGWSSSTSAGLGANAKTGTTSSPTTSWNGSTTNNKYYKDLRSEAGTVTLTANWTADTYTITYNLDGGTNNSSNPSSYQITTATINLQQPTKTGYTFKGWTGSNGSTAQTSVSIPTGSTGNKTYTANWQKDTYTITYNLNGGTNSSSNPSSYQVDTATINLQQPTKTGYTFTGWTGSNGSTAQTSVSIATGSTGNKTYTANWTANTYTIAYSLNNGALASGASNPTSGTYDQDVNIANEPSKTGYTFTGWTTSSSAGLGTTAKTGTAANPSTAWTGSLTKNKYFKNLRETSGTVTLTANYSENTYTIAFNNNTGTGSMNSLTGVKYTESKTLTSNTFTKTGYTFKGWATSASGAVAYNNGASVSKLSSTNGATVTLYAVWQKDTYTITYNLDGGTNSSSNPSSYQVDTATITLQEPTKKGYTFKGWTGSNGTTAQTSVSIPTGSTGNKTYTANWTKDTYTITYTLNGGTNHSSNPSSYQVDTATINLQPPTRTGYTFAGWTGSNGNTAQTAVAITTGSTGNKSYVANWGTNTYTIAYSLNGGALASGKTNPTNGTFDSDLNIANEPAKEGYTFTGWTTSSSAGLGTNAKTGTAANPSTAWTGSLTKNKYFKNLRDTSGTVTLTANYSENTYTIAFNNNGGIGTMTSLSGVKYTESKTLTSNTFTKSGYTFKGWATSASGAKVYDDGASVSKLSATNNATVTLYAVWQKDTYTISYTLNGGTNNASNPSTYQVDSAAINLQQPTKTGYTFAGWTGSNGTTAQTSVTIATGSTGNKSYTANWAANTYTISYNLSNGALEQGKTNPTSGTYDQDVNIANEPVKAGYTFTGWTTSSSAGLGTNAKTGTAANPSTAWTGSLTKNKYFKNLRDTSGTVTLTANFSANTNTKYTIKYFMQGFDTEIVSYEEDESLREEKQGTTDTTAQVQTADIKNVTGFTYDETNSRNKLSGTVTADGNLVLELYYKRNSYTITYEPNGGTMAGTTGRYYYGKRYTLNSNVARPGNTFMGWYDNSQFNGNTISYIEANETGNKTFYAKWSKEAYTITYTLNGGINANSNPANYDVETNTITLAQPTKVGYTFTGWTGSNGNTPSLNVTIPKGSTGNKSYTANWRANTYTIAYNLNGGELEQGKTNPTSGTYDQDVNIANEPVMLGYTFTGWTTNASSGLESTAKTGASENPNTSWNGTLVNNKYFKNLRNTEGVVTLTANFDANTNTKYTVKYFLQNFDTEIENYEEDESLRDEKQGTTNEQIQLTEDDINEVEGFTYDNANSRNKITGTVAADGSLILEVYFRRNIYSIRYETNGGTMPSTTNRYYYGRRFVLSQNIRKDSNVFLGWYDNSELNGNAVTYVEAGETGDKTFYAKWGEANNLYVEAMNNQCVVEDNMISKIGPNTKLSDLSNKITTNGNVVVKNKKGVQIGNNDLIGTGYTITISMNGQEKTYEASILGDIDGNGKTSMVDIVKANQGMLGKINLTNAQKKAADTSGDNRLTLLDIVRMNQAYLGKISL